MYLPDSSLSEKSKTIMYYLLFDSCCMLKHVIILFVQYRFVLVCSDK